MISLNRLFSLLVVATTLWNVPSQAEVTLTTLASFNYTNGGYLYAGLIVDANGNLYGTTFSGGTNGYGTVFKIAAGTHALTTLVSFNKTKGSYPEAGLIADANGNLYGTTTDGGANGYGTVFEIAAETHELTTLVSFNGTNGENPRAGLIADADGNLYGTTYWGGANDYGTVFKIAAQTHELTTLISFNYYTTGAVPKAGLIADANGNLYGTTGSGGANGYAGTVFKIAAGTHELTTLVSFNGINGENPQGGLIADANGNLFGTTAGGGGTVFEIAAGTHDLTTLVSFNGSNGSYPEGGLIADANGNLYGTTSDGGASNCGTVFKIAAGTHELTTLVSFNNANGNTPNAGLVADADGNLYGTTVGGGAGRYGTVFKLSGTGFVVVPELGSLSLVALSGIVSLSAAFLRHRVVG